jgi:hypothetical protein
MTEGKQFEGFHSIFKEILLDNIKTIDVKRNDANTSFALPVDFKERAVELARKTHGFLSNPRMLCIVDTFSTETVVKDKLQKGDRLIGINDSVINYFSDAPQALATLKNKDAVVTFLRGADTMHFTVRVPATGLLGFNPKNDSTAIAITDIHYSFVQSFGAGAAKVVKTLRDYSSSSS